MVQKTEMYNNYSVVSLLFLSCLADPHPYLFSLHNIPQLSFHIVHKEFSHSLLVL